MGEIPTFLLFIQFLYKYFFCFFLLYVRLNLSTLLVGLLGRLGFSLGKDGEELGETSDSRRVEERPDLFLPPGEGIISNLLMVRRREQ